MVVEARSHGGDCGRAMPAKRHNASRVTVDDFIRESIVGARAALNCDNQGEGILALSAATFFHSSIEYPSTITNCADPAPLRNSLMRLYSGES